MLATAGETIAKDELGRRRRAAAGLRRARREMDAETVPEIEGGYTTGRRRTGLRLSFRGGLPESVWGRVATGAAFLAMAGVVFAGVVSAEHLALRDQRFILATPAAIGVEGLHHLSRGQVLAALGGARGGIVGHNIFTVSLAHEREQLEQMPWVEHATVMRFLPDHLQASITERTPVAFARNGGRIDLVDASGVLLDMGAGEREGAHFSFPVVAGISPADPLSVRGSRMKIFADFMSALDARGEHISSKLSEIDLSNPEDVKALIPESGTDVLVHFGDGEFLERFRRFEKLLPEWRAQYPKLAGVDMRYERQVVLEMQPGTNVAPTATTAAAAPTAPASSPQHAAARAATARPHHAPPAVTPHTQHRSVRPQHHAAVPR